MNHQQFQEEEPPRSQRMTEGEARAVIDLWQHECADGGLTTSPAVQDVAEGLDISVEDVQRLLQKVRARRAGQETLHREQQQLGLVQQRLAEEGRQLAAVRQEWERMRRRHAELEESPVTSAPPKYLRPTCSLPFTFNITPPSSEELTETMQKEARGNAERRRFGGYVLVAVAVIGVLADLLAQAFR